MNNLAVCERTPAIPTAHRQTSQHITHSIRLAKRKNVAYEDDLAQRWWALPVGCLLPASDGYRYHLLFAGRRGGSAGPDVRDAVLQRSPTEQLCGDIEFHTHASDWVTHQHHSDPRYNQVILHVVLYCDTPQPTRRQDGSIVPVCSLNDVASPLLLLSQQQSQWPCQHIMTTLSKQELSQRLRHAGLLRFEQKTSTFVEHIRVSTPATLALSAEATQQHYTTCLLIALAEALGYGRDRDLFRAIGLYLAGQTTALPEPLGRSPAPSPLDSQRLAFFRRLMQAWQQSSEPFSAGWQQIHATILHKDLAELRTLFCEQGLSLARTDILICNVVLPCAAAIALIEQEEDLYECATDLYLAHPGLSSNAITRMMCQQMGLAHEPYGACQQQGLHHIYQETCKQKHCSICIAGREQL